MKKMKKTKDQRAVADLPRRAVADLLRHRDKTKDQRAVADLPRRAVADLLRHRDTFGTFDRGYDHATAKTRP